MIRLRRTAPIRRLHPTGAQPHRRLRGQATVEFALASLLLLTIVLGTVDFGRSIFLYSQLHSAVRDAAREAKVKHANGGISGPGGTGGPNTNASVQNRVRNALNKETNAQSPRPGLQAATASYTCTGGCVSGSQLTVTGSVPFTAVTQDFLGIPPLTLTASATVIVE